MKKLLGFIVIVAIGIGIWYLFHRTAASVPTQPVVPITVTKAPTKPDPSNATFVFDGQSVTLKKGSSNGTVMETGEPTIETTLTDTIGYGDINNDGKEDSVAYLLQTGGGSGDFVYIAGYVSGPISYKGTNALFVGDRIQPKSISIKNGVITATYLDRKADDPMSTDPTISTIKTFVYSNGELVEKQ